MNLQYPTLSEQEQIERLRSLQGTRQWTDLFIQIDTGPIGQKLRDNVKAIVAEQNKFTLTDAGMLAVVFALPVSTLFQMIEDGAVLPSGTWERAVDRGATAKSVLDAGQQRLSQLYRESVEVVTR